MFNRFDVSASDVARFERMFELRDSGCWEWRGNRDHHGYGRIYIARRARLAHRISWQIANNQHPAGLVCHTCDNPAYVNPSHLFLGTHADNTRDMVAKGRARNRTTGKSKDFRPWVPKQPPNSRRDFCPRATP